MLRSENAVFVNLVFKGPELGGRLKRGNEQRQRREFGKEVRWGESRERGTDVVY